VIVENKPFLIVSEDHLVIPPSYLNPPLGLLLNQAGLVAANELLACLREQNRNTYQKIGRILAKNKVIDQETADFFVKKWQQKIPFPSGYRLGDYLREASLLNNEDIQEILIAQQQSKAKFGEIAVQKGLIRSQTADFFIQKLFFLPTLQTHCHDLPPDRSPSHPSKLSDFYPEDIPWVD